MIGNQALILSLTKHAGPRFPKAVARKILVELHPFNNQRDFFADDIA